VFFEFFAVTPGVFQSTVPIVLHPLRLDRGEDGRRPGEVSNQTANHTKQFLPQRNTKGAKGLTARNAKIAKPASTFPQKETKETKIENRLR